MKEHTPLKIKIQSTRFIITGYMLLVSSIFLPLHLINGEQFVIIWGLAGTVFGITKGIDGWKGNTG